MRLVESFRHGVVLNNGRPPKGADAARILRETQLLLRGVRDYVDVTKDDYARVSQRDKEAADFLQRAHRRTSELVKQVAELRGKAENAKLAVRFRVSQLESQLTLADMERGRAQAARFEAQKLSQHAIERMVADAEVERDVARLFAISLTQHASIATAAMERLAAGPQARELHDLEHDLDAVSTAVHSAALGAAQAVQMPAGAIYDVRRPDPGWVLGALHGGPEAILGMAGSSDPESLPQESAPELEPTP